MIRLSIIIPTYCEAENLTALVARIDDSVSRAGLSAEIIIVDDDSPDATREVCEQLRQAYSLRLLVRTQERGLSSAVVHGMSAARGEILLVMDADLSHPPEKIPELVAALEDPDTDFVIGSRYVAGGSTAGSWGVLRWLNSQAATLLARGLTSAKDPMAGFFAIRRQSFTEVAESLDPIGYKIGLELMVKANCRQVVECPIAFANRLHGDSKLTFREQVNYLKHLKRLYEFRFRNLAYLAQFLTVGCSGMLVDLSVFAVLLGVLPTSAARALAIWVAMTWNFALNRRLTFSYARHRSPLRQYLGFCVGCLLGAVCNWSTSLALCRMPLFAANKVLAATIGIVVGTGFNYTLCRYLVFGKHPQPTLARNPQPVAAQVPGQNQGSAPQQRLRKAS